MRLFSVVCLQAAEQQGQQVVVCSHLPICPDTCPPTCLVWNYEEILTVLRRHPGTVVASIAGHTHQNGYLVDEAGVHHMVLPGVVEAPPGRDCYGVVEVYTDRLVLKGVDICMSCTCKLPAQRQQPQQPAGSGAAAGAAGSGKSEKSSGGGCESDLVVDVADGSSSSSSSKQDC